MLSFMMSITSILLVTYTIRFSPFEIMSLTIPTYNECSLKFSVYIIKSVCKFRWGRGGGDEWPIVAIFEKKEKKFGGY